MFVMVRFERSKMVVARRSEMVILVLRGLLSRQSTIVEFRQPCCPETLSGQAPQAEKVSGDVKGDITGDKIGIHFHQANLD